MTQSIIKELTMAEKWLPVYSEGCRNMTVDAACDYFLTSARAHGFDHMRIVHRGREHVGNRVVFQDGSYADFYFESAGKPGAVLGVMQGGKHAE